MVLLVLVLIITIHADVMKPDFKIVYIPDDPPRNNEAKSVSRVSKKHTDDRILYRTVHKLYMRLSNPLLRKSQP